jgi:multicomponent Na+:H+ antiporter subunit G
MNNIIGIVLMFVGLFFTITGCIGVIRFPDIYCRLQAATKCATLGTCGILLGTMIIAGVGGIMLKSIICIIFILITSPTAAHALARSSHAFGIKLWDKSVVNQYDGDVVPTENRDEQGQA